MPAGEATVGKATAVVVRITLPAALAEDAGGRSVVEVAGALDTFGEVLGGLRAAYPAVHERLVTERGVLRPHVNVFVDGENIRYSGGVDTPVRDRADIIILPAVSGG